jgi:hypothetical protein
MMSIWIFANRVDYRQIYWDKHRPIESKTTSSGPECQNKQNKQTKIVNFIKQLEIK